MAALAPAPAAAQGAESHLPKATTWRQWLDREAWRNVIIAVPYLWLSVLLPRALLHRPRDQLGTAQIGSRPSSGATAGPSSLSTTTSS